MKKITIKKGNHLSYSQPISIPCEIPKFKSFPFQFTNESKYILNDEDQKDWNKLVGYSLGLLPTNGIRPAHYNSLRVGWSYDPVKDSFLLSPYWYENGQRGYLQQDLAMEVKAGEVFFVDFEIAYGTFYVTIWKTTTTHYVSKNIPINVKYGYSLPPYFGGNNPAPDTISYSKN